MSNNDVELDYAYLTQKALRGVVREVLAITQELNDVPGDHHFYIEFLTTAPGVEVSDELLGAYPERMTIVLQHKFEDLQVHDDHFEVTLHFKGTPDRLVVPFNAVTNFVDPSCDYALRFEVDMQSQDEADTNNDSADKDEPVVEMESDSAPESGGADVVSLDSFRKK